MDRKSLKANSDSSKLEDEIIIRLEDEDGLNYSDLDNMEYEEVKDGFEEDEYSNLTSLKSRKRSRNFTPREANLLYSIVEDYYEVVENKKTDHKTNRSKTKAWVEITNKFNQQNDNEFKAPAQIKTFYENLKKKRKRMLQDAESEEIILEPVVRPKRELSDFVERSEINSRIDFIEEYNRKKLELLEIEIEKAKAAKEQQRRLFKLQEEKLLLEIEEIRSRNKK